jgi:hypothetical protein
VTRFEQAFFTIVSLSAAYTFIVVSRAAISKREPEAPRDPEWDERAERYTCRLCGSNCGQCGFSGNPADPQSERVR